MKIIESSFELINPPVDVMETIMRAARCCYQSEPCEDTDIFVRSLVKRGHHSVLEHRGVTVRLIVDRGVSHELVRHRLASFSQESTRYCNYAKDDIEFIRPQGLHNCHDLVWQNAMNAAEMYYKALIKEGQSPQVARSVLPNSIKTELYMTANMREWRHVFQLRISKAAHPDIRHIMLKVLDEFKQRWEPLFGDINQEEAN